MRNHWKRAIGFRIKTAREQRHITQEALAAAVERSTETISNIECGKTGMSLQTLCTIAEQLNMPLRELFDFEPVQDRTPRREVEARARLAELVRQLQGPDLDVAVKQMEALTGRGR